MRTTTITSRFQIPGFHRWKDAPKKYIYLKNIHRHIFFFDVEIIIEESREVEFIYFKNWLEKVVKEELYKRDRFTIKYELEYSVDFGGSSCENIAEKLLDYLQDESYHVKEISVFEDNENGATIYCD